MPGMSISLTEAAAAFAVGESNPIGRRCSGTSGALLGFVSQISSGEHHSDGRTPSSSMASEMLARHGPKISEQTFQAAAGALPCGTAFLPEILSPGSRSHEKFWQACLWDMESRGKGVFAVG